MDHTDVAVVFLDWVSSSVREAKGPPDTAAVARLVSSCRALSSRFGGDNCERMFLFGGNAGWADAMLMRTLFRYADDMATGSRMICPLFSGDLCSDAMFGVRLLAILEPASLALAFRYNRARALRVVKDLRTFLIATSDWPVDAQINTLFDTGLWETLGIDIVSLYDIFGCNVFTRPIPLIPTKMIRAMTASQVAYFVSEIPGSDAWVDICSFLANVSHYPIDITPLVDQVNTAVMLFVARRLAGLCFVNMHTMAELVKRPYSDSQKCGRILRNVSVLEHAGFLT